MRKTLIALFLLLMATAASAETTVREYDDRVVIEVTGTPQSPEEKSRQEQQERIRALEYERQQLAAEQERLNRKGDGSETMDARQRRAALMEKNRKIQQLDEQLRDVANQQPSAMSASSGSASPVP